MTGTSHGNVFDYFNTFSAVLDWWFSSKPECHFFRHFLTGKNLHIINLGMKECFYSAFISAPTVWGIIVMVEKG